MYVNALDPSLMFFANRRPNPPIMCAALMDQPKATEDAIVNYFHPFEPTDDFDFSYKQTDKDGNSQWCAKTHPHASLPVTYDPVKRIFRLHPMFQPKNECWEYVRLPIMLTFVGDTTHTEHIATWNMSHWRRNTNRLIPDQKEASFLACQLRKLPSGVWWMILFHILGNGLVNRITINLRNPNTTSIMLKNYFITEDEGATYTRINDAPHNFSYTKIKAIYYPEIN